MNKSQSEELKRFFQWCYERAAQLDDRKWLSPRSRDNDE